MNSSNPTTSSYRRRPVSRAGLGPGLRRDDENNSRDDENNNGAHVVTSLLDRVLYRDGLMLVIDKPAGIAVHAGPGGGPHLEHWFPLLRFGLPRPPALAHRLDRDTSGCLVLGRHPKALRRLGTLFAEGKIEKVYWAVVEGAPAQPHGTINAPLRKDTARRIGWRMEIDPAGQRAVTEYRVLGSAGGKSWLELRPKTGRTHQIRVHCASLGCPVVGDPTYGGPAGKLLLHARMLTIPLYPARPAIQVSAPVPPHMLAALIRLGYHPEPETNDAAEETATA